MPPKQSAKRRAQGDAGPARKKASPKPEPTYDTYDEAMEGGVEFEEKGERYRDGEKALRFFEKAKELYIKAMTLQETPEIMYNLARVNYRLASEFLLPPSSLELYTSSCGLYSRVLQETTDGSLKNDAAFNLAQAMSTFADTTDELDPSDDGRESSREMRLNAIKLLQPVLMANLMFARERKENPALFEGETAAAAEEQKGDESMEVEDEAGDKAAEGEEGTVPAAKVSYSPTPDTLVDVILFTIELGLTLWPSQSEPPSEGEQMAMFQMLEEARTYGPEARQAEIDLQQIKVLLAIDQVTWDKLKDQVQAGDPGLDRTSQGAVKALSKLLTSLDSAPAEDATIRADILMTIAETELSTAFRYMTLAARTPAPEALAKSAWTSLSSATQHFNTAVELPLTASTPKEFRPNAYLELANTSLLRARLAPHNETAKQNVPKLLDNCAAYAIKAATALGWNFPRLPMTSAPNPPAVAQLNPPFAAGWDMEMIGQNVLLFMLRVCYFVRSGTLTDDQATKDAYSAAAKNIVNAIVSLPPGPRRLMPRDIGRYVNDIEDDEGKIAADEDSWWREIGQEIRRGLNEGDAPPSERGPIDPSDVFAGV